MKTLVSIIGVTTALSLFVAARAGGQETSNFTTPEVRQAAKEQADAEEALAQAQAREVQVTAQATATEVRKQMDQDRLAAGSAVAQTPEAADAARANMERALVELSNLPAASRAARGSLGATLVIRSAEADSKAQANLQEDLAVMSRVLDKALAQKADEGGSRRVMGVNVLFAPGQNPLRSLYLDGYGALFFLNVNFPLLPPPAKAEPPKEESKTNSAWDEARREIYGQPSETQIITGTAGNPPQSYDEGRVVNLKDTLLEALKAATNIRELKPDDSVTVCLFGAGTTTTTARVRLTAATAQSLYQTNTSSSWSALARTGRGSPQPVQAPQPVAPRQASPPAWGDLPPADTFFVADRLGNPKSRGATMTLRVKKSDADAFAKDKLTLDEFRKRAKIAIYDSGAD